MSRSRAAATTRLGQVLALEMEQREDAARSTGSAACVIRVARGEGALLDGDGRPFHDAWCGRATPEEVAGWLGGRGPSARGSTSASWRSRAACRSRLDAAGFGRHTFLCGQSGSGKTYSLGVLLERLLMETSLRVVVLDPNSDYVRLGETARGADPAAAERYAAAAGAVGGAERHGRDRRLRVRFRDLSPAPGGRCCGSTRSPTARSTRSSPRSWRTSGMRSLEDLARARRPTRSSCVPATSASTAGPSGPGRRASRCRRARRPGAPRCMVVDLGSLATREEQALAAGAVLERLWRRRARREPIAIVIDEAHNVCPAEPGDPLTALATEDAIRIAGEGRKFGLYLVVVDAAPAESARERPLAVRQPRPDADELDR